MTRLRQGFPLRQGFGGQAVGQGQAVAAILAVFAVLLVVCLPQAAAQENAADPPAKEEVPVGGGDAKKDDGKGQGKKLTVFELVGKILKVKVTVKLPKKHAAAAEDIASKVESAIKDCAVQEIRGNEKYLVNDDKLYRAKGTLSVKLDAGVFKKVAASVSGKSPIMKTCMGSLKGLETGHGELGGGLTVIVETGLK
ncbi:MAG: hypothetical protein HY897_10570 [Deltaproteobacteria bacterium]|nr:hypothetical protein [Deltaproteobacteria bacterium]